MSTPGQLASTLPPPVESVRFNEMTPSLLDTVILSTSRRNRSSYLLNRSDAFIPRLFRDVQKTRPFTVSWQDQHPVA
jgi:hypothetical protein